MEDITKDKHKRGKNSAEKGGKNSAAESGKNSAAESGKNSAAESGKNSAEKGGKNSAEKGGKNSAAESGKNSAEKSGKGKSGKNYSPSAQGISDRIKQDVAEKIICATCSTAMRAELMRCETKLTDFDLLVLAYRYAPDFRTRIQLLQLVEIKADDKPEQTVRSKAADQAARCIAYEKAKLERFMLFEEGCVFEVEISAATCAAAANPIFSIAPKTQAANAIMAESAATCAERISAFDAAADIHACRLLAKTFDGALEAAREFFLSRGIIINERTRFSITKRRIFDKPKSAFSGVFGAEGDGGAVAGNEAEGKNGTKGKSSGEYITDFEGVAHYKGNFILCTVSHKRLCDNTVIASDMACFDRDCKSCDDKPCILHYAPKLPCPFAHFDLVFYTDRLGERHFCLVLDIKTVQSDECAFLLPLRAVPDFTDKDELLRFLENEHIQIEFPLLEKADPSDLSPEARKCLTDFKNNYTRFCG